MSVKDKIFRDKDKNGITEDTLREMVEKGVIDEEMSILNIPAEECRKIPGASIIEGADGAQICALRVFKKPGDNSSAYTKKIKIAEE